MTLPAFAAERRCLLHGPCSALAAVDRYMLPAGRSTTNPPAAVAAVDGRTLEILLCLRYRLLCGQRQQIYDTAYNTSIGYGVVFLELIHVRQRSLGVHLMRGTVRK